eukprot:COSAG02_NODE_16667_length_1065_cov_5.168737_1_plen_98_part_00
MATSKAGYSTYRLSATLARTSQNLYAVYGSSESHLIIPPAFQVPPPFGTNVGGVNPQFFGVNGDAEFDSWFTVGDIAVGCARTFGPVRSSVHPIYIE